MVVDHPDQLQLDSRVPQAQPIARLDRRVLLFDGDLGLANVDIQLGLNPERDLGEVLSGRRDLEDVTLPCANGGFDVVDDLAIPLPVTIIAEMLGVDAEREGERFRFYMDHYGIPREGA